VPRAGGYFYSVPNNDLLSFSYDENHFASSLEISVEDKIKRGKPPRIHLAGRLSARSLLYCLRGLLPGITKAHRSRVACRDVC